MPVIKRVQDPNTHSEHVAILARPDEAESHWQPVPANGYVEIRVSEEIHPSVQGVDHGIQVVAPDSFVREHAHPDQDELLFFYQGEGVAIVEDEEHALTAGTSLFVGAGVRHKFVNTSKSEVLKFGWTLLPGGLGNFFRQIGRPRTAGDAAPENFARPENVDQIERDTVFADLKKD